MSKRPRPAKSVRPLTCFSPAAPIDADAASQKFEARKIAQDAVVWPVKRYEMRHAPTIRDRMAEDLKALFGSVGPELTDAFCRIHLRSCGWTARQVDENALRALTKLRAPAGLKADALRPGDWLVADGGFFCVDEGDLLAVRADDKGELFIPCRDGRHYLEGQTDENGDLIGLRRANATPCPVPSLD